MYIQFVIVGDSGGGWVATARITGTRLSFVATRKLLDLSSTHPKFTLISPSVSMLHIQLHVSRIATNPADLDKDENIPNDGRPSVEAIRSCRVCVGWFQANKRVIVSVGQSLALAHHEPILAVPALAVLLRQELDRHEAEVESVRATVRGVGEARVGEAGTVVGEEGEA